MGCQLSEPVSIDTTVLSNFASTGSTRSIGDIVGSVLVVSAVRDELDAGVDYGHQYLEDAIAFVESGDRIERVSIESSVGERVRRKLDRGEAAALLGAVERNGSLASDDLAARNLASEHGVAVTGSVGILALGIEHGDLSIETADRWLDTWQEQRGYYAPVDSIETVLED